MGNDTRAGNRLDYATPATTERPILRRRSWWPPVLAWLGATGIVLGTCLAYHFAPFAPVANWAHEDGRNYLSIASNGYHLVVCGGSRSDPVWCGNAGWFPAYPWSVGGLHLFGLPLAGTAVAVSWLASLGTLIVLWRCFMADRPNLAAGVALCYAALAPGLVYDYAAFPLSLTNFCAVTSFALLQRRRPLAAGMAAAAAALAYPVGLAVAPAGALWLLCGRGTSASERLRQCGLLLAPWLAGLAAFALVQRISTGRWNAYLLVQQKYGHKLSDPLTAVAAAFRTFVHWPLMTHPSFANLYNIAGAISLQALLVFAVIVIVLTDLAVRHGASLRAEALIAVWAVLAWLLLYSTEHVDGYRGEAALLPIAIGVRRLPCALSVPITMLALCLVSPVTHMYLAVP